MPLAIEQELKNRLQAALTPIRLEISNDSYQHRRHAAVADDTSGATHFSITIVTEAFTGVSRIQRNRMAFAAIGDLMENPIHAVQLTLMAPGEV